MSGRGRGKGNRGGRGRGRGSGRSNSSRPTPNTSKLPEGQCKALGKNVFDWGDRSCADLLRTTSEKLIIYVGTKYGNKMSNELRTRIKYIPSKPEYRQEDIERHEKREQARKDGLREVIDAYKIRAAALLKKATDDGDTEARAQHALLKMEIRQFELDLQEDKEIELTGAAGLKFKNDMRTYREMEKDLEETRGNVFNLILGQCTQPLVEQMKCDSQYQYVIESSDPLKLLTLIERTVFTTQETKYPGAIVYESILSVMGFQQNNLSVDQYHEKLTTRFEVAASLGVTFDFKLLQDFEAQNLHSKSFEFIAADEKEIVVEAARQRFQAYVQLRNTGTAHQNLKTDLHNDYTKATDDPARYGIYPATPESTFNLLKNYSKSLPKTTAISEGGSFAQKGETKGKSNKPTNKGGDNADEIKYSKAKWADKHCEACGVKGHPHWAKVCHKFKDQDDNRSVSSRRSTKSTSSSKGGTKLAVSHLASALTKSMKQNTKMFKSVNKSLEKLAEESDISDSDDEDEEGSNFFTYTNTKTMRKAYTLHNSGQLDLRNVILLDSESTMDLFCNKDFVENIRESNSKIKILTIGGSMTTSQKVDIPGYRSVWYSPKAIANIYSLAKINKYFRVIYDSDNDDGFVVNRTKAGLPTLYFTEHPSGLHIYDPRQDHQLFLQTVQGNMEGFTKQQLARAKTAKELLHTLAFPSKTDFKWAVTSNQIKDCPITAKDIENAEIIWGRDVATLKGKTVRGKVPKTREITLQVPRDFLKHNREVNLQVDVFFVNEIAFFATLSAGIYYTSVTHINSRKATNLFNAFKQLYKFYLQRGFRITLVNGDPEFEPLAKLIVDMPRAPRTNVASANEHVEKLDRRIRVLKERARAIRHSLPYGRIPKLMIIHLVFTATRLINYFIPKGGISTTHSPHVLLSGIPLEYKRDLALPFGAYCQVHQEDTPRNSDKARTVGAVCLGSKGNTQGGQWFLNLETGKKMSGYKWDQLPIPDTVIQRVNYLGKDQPKRLTWYNRHGEPIGDSPDGQLTGVEDDTDHPDERNKNLDLDIQEEMREIAEQELDQSVPQPQLQLPNAVNPDPTTETPDTSQLVTPPVVEPEPGTTAPETLQTPINQAPDVQSTGVR